MTGPALKAVVEQLFQIVRDRSTTQELVFVCPVPGCGDESGNRSVNLRTGQTNCWRCNNGGDFVKWARFLGYEVEEGGTIAAPLPDLDFEVQRTAVSSTLPVVRSIPLPLGFHRCADYPKSVYTRLIGNMARRKNLDIEDFTQAGVGFTIDDPKWEPYAIFPVFDYGHTVYYQGRTYTDIPGESTKLFPNRTEAPNGAKFWVYGIDELRASRSAIVIVMESILNVLSMRRFLAAEGISDVCPVAVFKHYLSAPQSAKILDVDCVKEVCLLYDRDATRRAWLKAPRLYAQVSLTIAEMPLGPGGGKNDPNDDVVAAWQAFEQRVRATPLEGLQLDIVRTPISTDGVELPPVISPLDNLGLDEHFRSKVHAQQNRKAVWGPRRPDPD